uniref:Uncharacterized protein n=1 Tax=Ciona savignyi TaxID=51511 RepID=H2YY72_CIOSA
MVLEACIDAKSLDERITEKAQLVTDSGLESPKEVQEETEHDTLTSKIREETEEAEIEILTEEPTCESTSSDLVIQDGEVSLLDGELYQDNEVRMENLKQFLREEENINTSVEECADERNNSKMSVSIERGGERKSSLKKPSAPNKKTNIPSLSTATAPAKRSSYASSGKKAASTGALGPVILKDSGEKSSPVIREASFAVFKHSDAKAPNRPPLAVLGHCNSPETTKGRSNRFGTSEQHSIKNQSRVPRYRGSRSSTQSITNAAALNGKEN